MKYDLIIVGGGILGIFHAYHAAELKKKVLLIDKDRKASGSSVQNFGQIVPSGLSGKWLDYGLRTLEIYKKLMHRTNLSLVQNGSIYVASDEEELLLLGEMEEIHVRKGIKCELKTKDVLSIEYPFINKDYAQGGLFYEADMSVDPLFFVHNLLDFIVETSDVQVKSGHSVVGIDEGSNGVSVSTSDKMKYYAEKTIVCNGYIVNILFSDIFYKSGMEICKLQMMKTEALHNIKMKSNVLTGLTIRRYESFKECNSIVDIQSPDRYAKSITEGVHILFKQNKDGSIIIGDSHHYAPVESEHLINFSSINEIDDLIINEAQKIVDFPLGSINNRWTGRYLQHKDGIFEKDITSNIEICTGIGGKGMSSSAGYAEYRIKKLYNG